MHYKTHQMFLRFTDYGMSLPDPAYNIHYAVLPTLNVALLVG